MKYSFVFEGEKFSIDVLEMNNVFSKSRGLMFRRDGRALLFKFSSSKLRNIHSFFCKPFIALWFDENNSVDAVLVNDWKFSINPGKRFNELLEIPLGHSLFSFFSRRCRKL